MKGQQEGIMSTRKEQLRKVVEAYFRGLQEKDFQAIPYDENARLRAPLAPGGVNSAICGKDSVRTQWWNPLEPALDRIEIKIIDHYFNESLTAICTEAEIRLNVFDPPVTLRVADRFTVSAEGKILEQENHFDPRDVTNPGWQRAE